MSAAEKLRALAEEPVRNMFKLGDALPQIVAVVEAAENPNALRGDLDRALAALDEALS